MVVVAAPILPRESDASSDTRGEDTSARSREENDDLGGVVPKVWRDECSGMGRAIEDVECIMWG